MYLMYVDDVGDPGLTGSACSYFGLSAIIVHESRWRELLNRLISFRKSMKTIHGLPIKCEIHSSEYIRSPPIANMQKGTRLAILRQYLDELAKIDFISVISVMVNKTNKPQGYDAFESAWKALIQRYENTLQAGNFHGNYLNDKGIIISDNTNNLMLRRIHRKMSVINNIPNRGQHGYRNMPIQTILEDVYHKNSKDTFLIQSCDVISYFLLQNFAPNRYISKTGAKNYYSRISGILNRRAAPQHPLGIVLL